jgi:hypothetical protein
VIAGFCCIRAAEGVCVATLRGPMGPCGGAFGPLASAFCFLRSARRFFVRNAHAPAGREGLPAHGLWSGPRRCFVRRPFLLSLVTTRSPPEVRRSVGSLTDPPGSGRVAHPYTPRRSAEPWPEYERRSSPDAVDSCFCSGPSSQQHPQGRFVSSSSVCPPTGTVDLQRSAMHV